MATPNAGCPAQELHVPEGLDDSSQPSASDSSSREHHPRQPPATTCQWQTPRYHGRECSRYFDCPSHLVERALSDTVGGSQGQEAPPVPPIDLSTLTGPETIAAPALQPPAAGMAPQQGQARPASANTAELLAGAAPVVSGRIPGTGSGSGNAAGGWPTYPVPGFLRRDSGAVAGPQTVNISAPSSAAATTLVPRPAQSQQMPAAPGRTSEVVLPRWQPDSEVTYCPICGTQFSIFVRKHHCRKCGRVVCNSCSPHRITIPSQYIVRPPGTPRILSEDLPLALLNGEWFPEFSGGERVRLCNPCVPDPNTAPPQSREGQPRPQLNVNTPAQTETSPLSNRWSFYFGTGDASGGQTRSRSATMQPAASSAARAPLPLPRTDAGRILWGTPPAYSSTSQRPRLHQNYQTLIEGGARPGPSSAATPYAASTATRNFHMPVPTRPQIPEEDECPVCHRELPPRTLPNFESLREAHITSCIASHSRYGGGGPSTAAAGNSDDPDALLSGDAAPAPRLTGMFPYTATEKDCVDSAECSICLEEFEVGVAMARLECLCRFHRACINAWWQRHPGRCPMHQHDGYGF